MYFPQVQETVSVGGLFSIYCRQTGHFFCHISIPNLFFKLVTGPTSKKSVPSRDSAVCLNRHKSKSVPYCTEATLSTRYSAEAHRFAGISPFKCARVQKQKSRVTRWMEPTRILFAVSKSFFAQMRRTPRKPFTMKSRGTEKSVCIAMEKPKTFVLLSVLAAGSLLFGMASCALSEDAAEESRARGSFRDARRGESPITERTAGVRLARAVSIAATIQNKPTRRLRENSCARSSQMSWRTVRSCESGSAWSGNGRGSKRSPKCK